MADKQMYAVGDFKYGTRMMRAGDPVTMNARDQRLYLALKKVSPKAPPKNANITKSDVETVAAETVAEPAKKAPAKRKATRRKKTA